MRSWVGDRAASRQICLTRLDGTGFDSRRLHPDPAQNTPPQISRHDPRHTLGGVAAAEAALRYLTEGAAGRPCADLAVALAEAVLADESVRLALEVLDGGEFLHRRATELAARVLAEVAAAGVSADAGAVGGG